MNVLFYIKKVELHQFYERSMRSIQHRTNIDVVIYIMHTSADLFLCFRCILGGGAAGVSGSAAKRRM